jgi:hypothetical protein
MPRQRVPRVVAPPFFRVEGTKTNGPNRFGRPIVQQAHGVMADPQIALAVSSGSFGLVIGFFAGYAVRAYISYLRRREKR